MKIGILGTGNIGKTLVIKLSEAGHDVKVANSRGPESIDASILANGAKAETAEEALNNVEVVILSIPPTSFDKIKEIVAALPPETVVIDTSNYYPHRDGKISALEAGKVQAEWTSEQFNRPVAKAWNAIGAGSFSKKGQNVGHPERLAIPVAADRQNDRDVALRLVDETGFDGFDAGPLAESWRQEPGSPVYCTDLKLSQIESALGSAVKERLPKRRDIVVQAITERTDGEDATVDPDYFVRINRAVYL
ncbi:NADPH-dependent F420 reductase [Pseudomonas oryzihabitans]|uniref:NADP oxidoreductase n=1 Tax=Pseudomonas oryzihabitans TaxID=47885 RepID=A0ABX3INR6_9PSED|nr:NADP oxidoreductase [Pseudomonas psychrotolerans]